SLAPQVRQLYVAGFTTSLTSIFLVASFIAAGGFVMSWFLPETPLRDTVAARAGAVNEEIGEVFPRPGDEEGCADDERIDEGKRLAAATNL
ncbi:MAG TPA: hypothetical protein VKO87_04325, partial [Gemmatimonadaceae bacterium]|nr:hypothetical protein [Gemmatimonadaceae bacterium]